MKGNGRGRGRGRPRAEDALERLEVFGNDVAPAPRMSRADSIKKERDCANESKSHRRISNLIGVLHDVQAEAEASLPASALGPSEQQITIEVLQHAYQVACPILLKTADKTKINACLQVVQSTATDLMRRAFLETLRNCEAYRFDIASRHTRKRAIILGQ